MFRGNTFSLQRMSNYRLDRSVESNTDPQKTMKLPKIEFEGFLGYAINFIYLDDSQVQRDLRRRLWWNLVKDTVIMTAREQALRAQEKGLKKNKIVTLDGYVYIPMGPDVSVGNKYLFVFCVFIYKKM